MERNRTLRILVATLLGAAWAAPVLAAEPDWDNWACKFCPFPEAGPDGEASVEAIDVSQDSARFGRYTGLDENRIYGNADADVRFRGEGGYSADVRARDLGLDSRSAELELGRQGFWSVALSWDELPYRLDDSVSTVYSGLGSSSLGLPSNWVRSDFTDGMTALPPNLNGFELGHDRETLGLGVELVQSQRLRYELDWSRQTKEGQGLTWGSFLGSAATLAEPIDYQTDQVDAALIYAAERWSVRAAYYGSFFSNRDLALGWDNAFTGPDQGRMALAPDNRFNQVLLSGSYRLDAWDTTISASYAMGRAEQTDALLPYTVNTAVGADPLPRSEFDGEANTLHGDLRVVTRPTDRLRLVGEYRYDQRDNDSGRDTWNIVQADTFASFPAANPIYSFQDTDIRLVADYAFTAPVHAWLGWEREIDEQDFQNVDELEEDRLFGKLRLRPTAGLAVSLKGELADRDGDGYRQIPSTVGPGGEQNPLLRKYYLADRERDAIEAQVDATPGARSSLSLRYQTASDDYDNSAVGLVSADFDQFSVDGSINVWQALVLSAFWSTERYDSRQIGAASQGAPNNAPPNWDATTQDEQDVLGVALDWPGLGGGKVDLRLDYVNAKSSGDIDVATVLGGDRQAFPRLESDLKGLQLMATLHVSPSLSIEAGWRHEEYDADDWSVDGIGPATVSSLLSFGADTQDYDVDVFLLGFQYRFIAPQAEE